MATGELKKDMDALVRIREMRQDKKRFQTAKLELAKTRNTTESADDVPKDILGGK